MNNAWFSILLTTYANLLTMIANKVEDGLPDEMSEMRYAWSREHKEFKKTDKAFPILDDLYGMVSQMRHDAESLGESGPFDDPPVPVWFTSEEEGLSSVWARVKAIAREYQSETEDLGSIRGRAKAAAQEHRNETEELHRRYVLNTFGTELDEFTASGIKATVVSSPITGDPEGLRVGSTRMPGYRRVVHDLAQLGAWIINEEEAWQRLVNGSDDEQLT